MASRTNGIVTPLKSDIIKHLTKIERIALISSIQKCASIQQKIDEYQKVFDEARKELEFVVAELGIEDFDITKPYKIDENDNLMFA